MVKIEIIKPDLLNSMRFASEDTTPMAADETKPKFTQKTQGKSVKTFHQTKTSSATTKKERPGSASKIMKRVQKEEEEEARMTPERSSPIPFANRADDERAERTVDKKYADFVQRLEYGQKEPQDSELRDRSAFSSGKQRQQKYNKVDKYLKTKMESEFAYQTNKQRDPELIMRLSQQSFQKKAKDAEPEGKIPSHLSTQQPFAASQKISTAKSTTQVSYDQI